MMWVILVVILILYLFRSSGPSQMGAGLLQCVAYVIFLAIIALVMSLPR